MTCITFLMYGKRQKFCIQPNENRFWALMVSLLGHQPYTNHNVVGGRREGQQYIKPTPVSIKEWQSQNPMDTNSKNTSKIQGKEKRKLYLGFLKKNWACIHNTLWQGSPGRKALQLQHAVLREGVNGPAILCYCTQTGEAQQNCRGL